ncbi:hypothetical protein CIW71_24430 (plasmid) [Xanthomonas citri pv. malvacearum]|nr:hypothetical protein CIW71_24430 [Xanthomonas citri pv. malvacearum]
MPQTTGQIEAEINAVIEHWRRGAGSAHRPARQRRPGPGDPDIGGSGGSGRQAGHGDPHTQTA